MYLCLEVKNVQPLYLFYALSSVPCVLHLRPLHKKATDDAKIIERYKLMLNRKPKEGSTFDRLYQFYLEGAGLEAMVADYQAEVQAKTG